MKFRYFLSMVLIWIVNVQMECVGNEEELPLSESLKSYFIPPGDWYGKKYVYANLDDTTELDTYDISYIYNHSKQFDDITRGEGMDLYMGTKSQNIYVWCYAYLNKPSVMVDVFMPYYDPVFYINPKLDSSAQYHKTEWIGHSKALTSYSTPWNTYNDVIESDQNYKGPANPNGLNSKGIGFGRLKWAKNVGLIYFEGFFGPDFKTNPELKRVVLKEIIN